MSCTDSCFLCLHFNFCDRCAASFPNAQETRRL